jgi:eukaryotic-like serine/threonine-protein kinase
MGAVYRVRDEKLDEIVALKILTLESDQAAERFTREVRLARRVTHPNVARTHDVGEAGGRPFLTMEFVTGETLEAVLQREGALRSDRAAELGEQIAAGLDAAHQAGVVHRDLKPANVMIASSGRVVLTDFGIARALEADAQRRTTEVIGTPYYMSPEQVLGKVVDARSDLYSLGLILYELLIGDLPFRGETPIAVALARLDQAPPDPRSRADVPADLAQIVMRCLAVDPSRRPESAAALAAELSSWRARQSAVTSRTVAEAGARSSTGSTSSPGLYAPMVLGRSLAVLPFSYRGSADYDYLGEGLAEELVDVLSRTRGLRVMALGATKRFADDRDPARVRAGLGADVVIDGSIQVAGERVRITARLLDAELGVQRWTERFDGQLEDVFAFQEMMGRRVAEALRLEIDASSYGRRVPDEAVQLYLGARRCLRMDIAANSARSVEMLDRCVALAPGFEPALAAHAMASVRAWWAASLRLEGAGVLERARESVARAESLAPDIAETHLARAMFATQLGEYGDAATALARALDIAPTLAEAHQYLAEMQMEAGQLDEGMKRAKLALELDPSQSSCRLSIARRKAILGEHVTAIAMLDALEAELDLHNIALITNRIRMAIYAGDYEGMRPWLERLHQSEQGRRLPFASQFAVLLGEKEAAEADRERREMLVRMRDPNPRFTSLMGQLTVEIFVAAGAHDLAMEVLEEIAAAALIDVGWLDSLSLLAPLRERAEFPPLVARVRKRARAIWRRS